MEERELKQSDLFHVFGSSGIASEVVTVSVQSAKRRRKS
jgi:hypothetical protein